MKLKSYNFTNVHNDMFGTPSSEDFEIIKGFIKSDDIQQENIFVYPICLCDNQVDRDGECFSDVALTNICELSVGVVGIKNHDWVSENAHSRIYKADIEEENGIKSVIGYAYTLVTDSTLEFINNIKSGLLQEVSIGFSATSYSDLDGVRVIDGVNDVFEWSFVAVPAQPRAGVVKEYKEDKGVKNMDLEARIKELETEVETKSLRVKELETTLTSQQERIDELEKTIVDSALSNAVKSVLSNFKFRGCKAEEIAENLVRSLLTINDEGNVEGCDAAECALKEDYDFLYEKEDDLGTTDDKECKEENEDDTVEVKNYAVIADNIIKKSKKIDFTYIPDKK